MPQDADADAVAVRICVPHEASFSALVDHVHVELQRDGQPFAGAVFDAREAELIRRAMPGLAPAAGCAPARVTFDLRPGRPCRSSTMRIPQATTVSLYACQHGNFHIELTTGEETLGHATMNAEQFARFIGEGCDLLELVSRGGLALQPCEGVA
ncbi:MAG: hypothetical protein AB7U62_20925 [Pseudolabrys sp.]